MRRELSSTRPETAGQIPADVTDQDVSTSFRTLAARKFVIGTAATAALAAAAGLGVAAPAMTAAADSGAAPTTAAATPGATLNVNDTMDRTVTSGLGTAPTGGAWRTWGSTFSVSAGAAHLARVAPGASVYASLDAVQARDESTSTVFSFPALPSTGGGWYFAVLLRKQTNGDALYARVKVVPGGAAQLSTKLITGSSQVDVGSAVALPNLVAGRSYTLDAVATGGTSTTVSLRAYATGTTAPAWQAGGTASLNTAMATKGSVGMFAYASSSGGALSVDVDAITGQDLSAPATSPSSSPTSSSPSSSPTSSSPSSSPTSSSPSSSPTSSSPSSSPTSSSPSSSPTSSSPSPSNSPSGTPTLDGGIGFASNDPTSTPPTTTPPTTTPPTSTPPAPPAGKPGPDNTGVRPGVPLTVYNGSITAAAGQVLENLDIRGMVVVNKPNVVIRNCIVRGTTDGVQRPLIQAIGATNLQIVDSELTPSVSSLASMAALNGGGYTLTRVDIHGTVDGIQVHQSGVSVIDSWIHDLAAFDHDPDHGMGWTHNDDVQVFGGANLRITGSTLEGAKNSVLQTTPTPGFTPISNVVIDGNWLDGGGCSLNLWSGSGPLAPITITDNRFGNHQSVAGCAIVAVRALTTLVLADNVWDANDLPVVVKFG